MNELNHNNGRPKTELTRTQRELELVWMMIEDRPQFHAEYRQVMDLEPCASLSDVWIVN